MSDTRRVRQLAHAAPDAANSAHLHETSRSPLSSWWKVKAERVLSLDSVIADMRAILWPESRDQQPAEIEFVTRTSPQVAAVRFAPNVSRRARTGER